MAGPEAKEDMVELTGHAMIQKIENLYSDLKLEIERLVEERSALAAELKDKRNELDILRRSLADESKAMGERTAHSRVAECRYAPRAQLKPGRVRSAFCFSRTRIPAPTFSACSCGDCLEQPWKGPSWSRRSGNSNPFERRR